MLVKPFLDPIAKALNMNFKWRKREGTHFGSTISLDHATSYRLREGKLKDPRDAVRFLYDVYFDKAYDEK
jgi:hypothetical protein